VFLFIVLLVLDVYKVRGEPSTMTRLAFKQKIRFLAGTFLAPNIKVDDQPVGWGLFYAAFLETEFGKMGEGDPKTFGARGIKRELASYWNQ
jgi:hypothetical protein